MPRPRGVVTVAGVSEHLPNDRSPLPSWAMLVRPGYFDPRVLHHKFWIDVNAEVWSLDDLSTGHLQAIVGMLSARSRELYGAEFIETYLRVVMAREQGHVAGEQMVHDLGLPTITDLEPNEWLETTALLRAIRRILRGRKWP